MNGQAGINGCTQHYVDLTTFPAEFKTETDALSKYNEMGLLHRIQFKTINRRKDEQCNLIQFTLCCYKRKTVCKKVSNALQMKEVEEGD